MYVEPIAPLSPTVLVTVSVADDATVDVTPPRDDDWVVCSVVVAVPAVVSPMDMLSRIHSLTTLVPLMGTPFDPRLSSLDSHEISS